MASSDLPESWLILTPPQTPPSQASPAACRFLPCSGQGRLFITRGEINRLLTPGGTAGSLDKGWYQNWAAAVLKYANAAACGPSGEAEKAAGLSLAWGLAKEGEWPPQRLEDPSPYGHNLRSRLCRLDFSAISLQWAVYLDKDLLRGSGLSLRLPPPSCSRGSSVLPDWSSAGCLPVPVLRQ